MSFRELTIDDVPLSLRPYIEQLPCTFCGVSRGELCVRLEDGLNEKGRRTRPHRVRRNPSRIERTATTDPQRYPCDRCAAAPGYPCIRGVKPSEHPHDERTHRAMMAESINKDRQTFRPNYRA